MGKIMHRVTEINKRHQSALNLKGKAVIHQVKSSTWQINSLSNKKDVYTIEKRQDKCSCKLNCLECGICIHHYSCTCIDATIHHTIYKHLHLFICLL